MDVVKVLREGAKKSRKTIVLPEGGDRRIIEAAGFITQKDIADIILLGRQDEIQSLAQETGTDLSRVIVREPEIDDKKDFYSELLFDLRKHKGVTLQEAKELMQNPLYFGSLMVKNGDAYGMVAGAANSTGDVLRPALQLIKTKEGISSVSGAFLMVSPQKEYGEDGVMVFADCAVNPEPSAQELAEIAYLSSCTIEDLLGIIPRVAMLSFSTKGSASHPLVQKVIDATNTVRQNYPKVEIEGEIQADAALVPKVAELKAPESQVAGKANVLVFPDLQSGNIGYKLVQRLGKAEAIGPVIQGMAMPVNDLSRGCSVEDVINTVAMTALQK